MHEALTPRPIGHATPGTDAAAAMITTLAEMIEAEPQIGILLEQARRIEKPQWRHYSDFKRELSRLVGWYARNPRLASDDCYDLMIDALTDALRL